MLLRDLIRDIHIKETNGSLDIEVSGISYDSRQTNPGDVFVAIPGFKIDGAKFIPKAVNSGAVAVVAEKLIDGTNVPQVIVPSAREALALISNRFYDFPSRKLKVIGITGTKGKTTVAYLLEHILRASGNKVGLISTVEVRIDGRGTPSKMTTPESSDLQKILSQMVEEGVSHVVMEVSSHSLTLNRVLGTQFDIGVFTNLTHDHLDFHGSMDDYFKAKLKLFEYILGGEKKEAIGIVNRDDPRSKQISDLLKAKTLTYGINYSADLAGKNVKYGLTGMTFNMATGKEIVEVSTKLIGQQNVYNILAAALAALSLEEDIIDIIGSIENFEGAPGRFEKVNAGQQFPVIVDFAHSPDSLQKLLETYRPLTKGKIILVFGCPGDRDKAKRPMMGEIASRLADHVIITTDDPHSEEPIKIIEEIEKGIREQGLGTGERGMGNRYEKIADRREAIKKALLLAKPEDIVLIAGRGHEKYQDFDGKRVEIDDRDIVRGFFK